MGSNDSIFISAGDPSADYPGSILIDELNSHCPGMQIFGLGGALMRESGLEPLADYRRLAVMGFLEVIPNIRFFSKLLSQAEETIKKRHPRAIILMDYPGFNLRLAARIKKLGIPIIYFIAPQVWAWGRGRIKSMRELIDILLVIFPFEERYFRSHGLNARFVGHPIVDRYREFPDRAACRQTLQIGADKKILALLPGSRIQEVRRMLPVLLGAAEILTSHDSALTPIVAGIESISQADYAALIGVGSTQLVVGRTPEILSAADFVITSSGTATVEAAFFGRPMVVVYKTGVLTYQIARRLIKLDSISMVNIIAEHKIVPELIQHDATADKIAATAQTILHDTQARETMVHDLQHVREALGGGGVGRAVFQAIQEQVRLC